MAIAFFVFALLCTVLSAASVSPEPNAPRLEEVMGGKNRLKAVERDQVLTDDVSKKLVHGGRSKKVSSSFLAKSAGGSASPGPKCARVFNNPARTWAGQSTNFAVEFHCVHTHGYDMRVSGPLKVDVKLEGDLEELLHFDKEWHVDSWNETLGLWTIRGSVHFDESVTTSDDLYKANQVVKLIATVPGSKDSKNPAAAVELHMLTRAVSRNFQNTPRCDHPIAENIYLHPGDHQKAFNVTFVLRGTPRLWMNIGSRGDKVMARVSARHSDQMKFNFDKVSNRVLGDQDKTLIFISGTVDVNKNDNQDHGYCIVDATVSFHDYPETHLSIPFILPPRAASSKEAKIEETSAVKIDVDKTGHEEIVFQDLPTTAPDVEDDIENPLIPGGGSGSIRSKSFGVGLEFVVAFACLWPLLSMLM